MPKRERKYNLLNGFGPKLVTDLSYPKNKPFPKLPKGIIGIRAPKDIDHAPGGTLLFEDGHEESTGKYNVCVANFTYYGQTVYGRVFV